MDIRKFGFVAAAALAPAMSNASPEKLSFDACVSAFEKSLTAPGVASTAYKVVDRAGRFTGSVTQFFATEYTYDLESHNPKSGAVLARARCSTNERGAVLAFSVLPLEVKPPAIANLE